jgi:hypothetical protein
MFRSIKNKGMGMPVTMNLDNLHCRLPQIVQPTLQAQPRKTTRAAGETKWDTTRYSPDI